MTKTEKSPTAFRTISEVAGDLDLPQHVLRFWESKFPQVHPLKRGGGRRYYRPEDIAILKRIRGLLHDEGYTIRGVQKLLRDESSSSDGAAQAETAGSHDSSGVQIDSGAREVLTSAINELEDMKRLLQRTVG